MLPVRLALAIIAILFFVIIIGRPDEFRVTRSTTIAASPAAAFEQVNDFHKWDAWSPWAKLDPNMKKSYAGPESGQGSTYSWSGNDQVGEGKLTIAESHPSQHVKLDLEFIKPWQAKSNTEFMFTPEGNGTKVTWTMAGSNNFTGKAFGMLMNMDKMIGDDFDKGLAQLKAVSESPAS